MQLSDGRTHFGLTFPIAVGGVGGSGTRIIADILGQFGYYLGGDLNKSKDNLWYTSLFKRRSVVDSSREHIARLARIFSSAMSGWVYKDADALKMIEDLAAEERYEFNYDWLSKRSKSLRNALLYGRRFEEWAWKEPNTHVLIEQLAEYIPNLRYIHVIRDGRDMAFSPNKTQLHYWSDTLFGMTDFDPDKPSAALHYWRLVNERIVRLRERSALPILEVGFECICERPTEQILAVAKFCNHPISSQEACDIGARTVRMPPTVGRHREMDLSSLDADDCHYARETKSRLFSALEHSPYRDSS